ncbi:hypothetical protein HPB51_015058 [Rhipicephalus microplus]|uniref:PB1 domain-containing protein n=1 Tax=Rhipicephalus microplus TaxID=6941 RepID=A0A9J6EU55_RHIMP|nr:hypothetical protein HPB51_015058 [Rhipicephalus microplus]
MQPPQPGFDPATCGSAAEYIATRPPRRGDYTDMAVCFHRVVPVAEMGYVFCLVIFQSGNRRKLKLATGAYSELVEKLTEIVDVDHKNTLVQMFDTDLDDFVDLVPGEKIPNKAKLRVISRKASALCNPAVATAGRSVAPPCLQNLVVEIPSETVRCSDAAVQTVPFGGCGSPGCTAANVTRTQDAWCAMQPSMITEACVDITPAVTRDKKDHLKFVLPPSFGGWCDLFLQRKRPITRKVRTHIISVLFKACYRMTLIYLVQSLLASGSKPQLASQEPPLNSSGDLSGCKDPPVQAEELNESKSTSTHKAENSSDSGATPSNSVQFCVVSEPMECVWKSEQLEDVEWVDYPDYSDAVLEDFTVSDPLGMCTDQKASEALMAQQGSLGSPDDERDSCDEPVEEVSPQEDEPSSKPEQRGEVSLNRLDPIVVSPSSKSTEQTDDPMDDLDHAVPAPSSKLEQQVEVPLEEPEHVVLVPDSKPAEQAEVFLQEPDPVVLVPSPKPMEQVEEDLQEAEHVEFELPSFGVFDELLCMKVPVSSTMQQHIVFSLFNALSKKTFRELCVNGKQRTPALALAKSGVVQARNLGRRKGARKKEQIEEAVACLLHKYPHLSSVKTKNGKWIGEELLEYKGKAHPQGEADVAAALEGVDGHKRKLAIERHSIIHEMSVEEVVLKFPIFREESAIPKCNIQIEGMLCYASESAANVHAAEKGNLCQGQHASPPDAINNSTASSRDGAFLARTCSESAQPVSPSSKQPASSCLAGLTQCAVTSLVLGCSHLQRSLSRFDEKE